MIGCFYGITTLNSAIEVFWFPFISSMGSVTHRYKKGIPMGLFSTIICIKVTTEKNGKALYLTVNSAT